MEKFSKSEVDFIHIGVMRSGSTWLELALNENPQIELHKVKSDLTVNNIPLKNSQDGVCSGLINEKLMYQPGAANYIKRNFPNAKIMVVLRDPVKRLISGYFLYKSNHINDEVGFEDFVSKYDKGDLNFRMGLYRDYLMPFYEEFDTCQLGVFVFDDLERSPTRFIKEIYGFLEVDSSFKPRVIHKKKNIGVSFGKNFLLKVPFLCKKYGFQRVYRFLERYLNSSNNAIFLENAQFLQEIRNIYESKNDGLDEMFNINTNQWYQ